MNWRAFMMKAFCGLFYIYVGLGVFFIAYVLMGLVAVAVSP